MFKARSPLTHLITVQTTHQSKTSVPIKKCSVKIPIKKYRKSNPKRCYLKLEMRLTYAIRPVSLKIGDHNTDKNRYSCEKANEI